jgi:hypothetical protein
MAIAQVDPLSAQHDSGMVTATAMPMDQIPPPGGFGAQPADMLDKKAAKAAAKLAKKGGGAGPDVLREVNVALKRMGLNTYIDGFAAQQLTGVGDLAILDAAGW